MIFDDAYIKLSYYITMLHVCVSGICDKQLNENLKKNHPVDVYLSICKKKQLFQTLVFTQCILYLETILGT